MMNSSVIELGNPVSHDSWRINLSLYHRITYMSHVTTRESLNCDTLQNAICCGCIWGNDNKN